MKYDEITLVAGAIHNRKEPRHYMTIRKNQKLWSAEIEGHTIARSQSTLEVKEVGLEIYSPVIYFPLEDVDSARLKRNAKSTFCPLKGSTYYLDFISHQFEVTNVAWVYKTTISEANRIENMMAFDTAKVRLLHTS